MGDDGWWDTCNWCFGSGLDEFEWDDRCRACAGVGEVWAVAHSDEDDLDEDALDEAARFAAEEVMT